MIRFRVGTSWKREPAGPDGPRDAFAVEIDGVNLVPGASDEPLWAMVSGVVEAVAGLVVDGERAAQLSLDDVRQELCLWRRPGLDVALTVVGLSPPRARPAVTVELPQLVDAAVQCARRFLREARGEAGATDRLRVERRLTQLASTVVPELPHRPVEPWTAEREVDGVAYRLSDAEGRALSYTRRSRAGLPALLIDGEVSVGDVRHVGPPFLTFMGLARDATESQAAKGRPGQAAVVFAAGLDLCLMLRARHPALGKNPWLEALQVRCSDGLRALHRPVPAVSVARVSTTAPRGQPATPMVPAGELRRVAYTLAWTRSVSVLDERAQLELTRGGPVVTSARGMLAFSPAGAVLARRAAARGVATREGVALCASSDRLLLFPRRGRSARWFRDHDGTGIGPELLEPGPGLLVTGLGQGGLVGLDAVTGRERWRFEPPRTQRLWPLVVGRWVLAASDGGALFGVDSLTGQVGFTLRSSLPAFGPPVRAGRGVVVTVGRGEHVALFFAELPRDGAQPPVVRWTRELSLRVLRPPVAHRGRFFVCGQRDGRAEAVAVGSRGQVLWERAVRVDARRCSLIASDGGLVVADTHGAAARLLPDGQPAWSIPGGPEDLPHPIAATVTRRILVIPAPVTRLVDPSTGRVLAQLETGPRVTDLKVDARLTLHVLKEPQTLEVWRPGTVLALVPPSPRR